MSRDYMRAEDVPVGAIEELPWRLEGSGSSCVPVSTEALALSRNCNAKSELWSKLENQQKRKIRMAYRPVYMFSMPRLLRAGIQEGSHLLTTS